MEGTREELFEELDLWSAGQFPQDTPKRFYFLSGGAGLGKSAIAHQLCSLETSESTRFSLGASFFFVRGSLESARSFFPSIAHQLAMSQPWLCPYIVSAAREYIKHGDNQQMKYSFDELLRKPLIAAFQAHSASPPSLPIILVIDGLDECGDRALVPELLRDLLELVRSSDLSWLRILVAARPEPHIMAVLTASSTDYLVHHRSLNDTVDKWSRDVRRYLEETVPKIEPYGEYLKQHPDDLETLVRRAGGVFIYARVAVSFLEVNRGWPAHQQFRSLLHSTTGAGLSPLDQLYLQVLELAFPLEDFKHPDFADRRGALTLFLQLLTLRVDPLSYQPMVLLSGWLDEALGLAIADRLRSVLFVNGGKIMPIHATFTEFLTDEERCINPLYYVNENKGHADIASAFFKLLPQAVDNCINEISQAMNGQDKLKDSDRLDALQQSMSYIQFCWSQHLAEAEYTGELLAQLQVFILSPIPLWLQLLFKNSLWPINVRQDMEWFFQVGALFLSSVRS